MALQEQGTQRGLGLSQGGGIAPNPPASLTDELRLWPPHQPHMEPDPQSSLPTRDYRSHPDHP